ncbi:MAG TPA: Gfo/Idh/MocA family oxidoreductase [Deltaproteobacteria bacterium]|nr:Gfo/Idh/MocA family oxidoreductase [Deltaproteobacteria bacterium]
MNPLKAAVIGVGYLGRFHALKYAAMEDVELLGVVDIDQDRAVLVSRETGTQAYTSAEGIIDRLDAVSIAVPTSAHAEVAMPFLERGIAVLLEKPIAARIEDAVSLIDAAHRGSAMLQIGHLERFNPALKHLQSSITHPMFIEAHRISPFRQRGADVDVILDIMIHDLDIILSLVTSEVTSVESVGVPVLTGSVDIANARIKFASGCIANITASRVSAEIMRKIRIFQSDSYISIDFAQSAVDIYTLTEHREITHTHLKIDDSDALAAELRSFVDAVREGSQVEVDGEAGLKAVEMAYRVKDSMVVP